MLSTDFESKKDDYYPRLPVLLKKSIKEFNSMFFGVDELYLIIGEFGRFIEDQMSNEELIKKCITFIDKSLNEGGMDTEDVFVIQIFMAIYHKENIVNIYRKLLSGKALEIFNEFYEKRND
ncbi:DUF7674 family protein [Hymenobacter arcticus]